MSKKYDPKMWDLDHLLDSTVYEEQWRCVDFIEFQITEFDERNQSELEATFIPLIRISFLLACVAQMEHHLKKICDVVREMRNFEVRQTDLRGANGFESCIEYLKKVLQVQLPEPELKLTRSIVALRNAWVHQGGYVDTLPQNLGPATGHVGMTAEGQIDFLDEQFFREASTICRGFVELVVHAIEKQSSNWTKPRKGRNKSK